MASCKPQLTISILISNRPDTIPRCLDSLALIREVIPSELILIDTSKSKEIHQMLLTYTDQVYEFEWCNDFAKARNEGVRRANGEWFMYLDDDEWLVETDEIIHFFHSGEYRNYGAANFMLRNFLTADYSEYADTWVSRLFHLEENVQFVGKVHEYMQYTDNRHIFLQAMANHSGYIFDTPEKRRKHFERNASLLLELVEEEPDNMRWQGQMVQEYRSVKEWEKNIEFCENQLSKEKALYSFMDYNHYATLYAGWIEALMRLECCEEAIAVGERARQDANTTELLKAYVAICQAECWASLGKWREASTSAKLFLAMYELFDVDKKSSQEQLGALIVQNTFDEEYVETARNIVSFAQTRIESVNAEKQLTISLLASNRPNELRRCLDSLRPIVEKLACELILIDTSKNPVVNKILREYTDQVYEFEWCKDFAKARNEGLKRAKGEWFMYLDDDEWFVEYEPLIEFFQSGEYKNYGYADYQVRNFLDTKYENYTDVWVSRLVRIEKDTQFVSKIHEYFAPIRGAKKYIPAMIYHSGYIYETEEARQAHFERNCSLLLEMIQEEPNNLRWRTQLALEYCSKGEWDLLENLCKESLCLVAKEDSVVMNRHIATFYVGLSIALLNKKRYEECVELCKTGLSDKRSREFLKAYMYLKLGESYFRLAHWEEAIMQVKKFLGVLQEIDLESAEMIEQSNALLVGNAFDHSSQKLAYSILIAANLQKGSLKELRTYYSKLGWNQTVIVGLEDIEKVFVHTMWTHDFEPVFAEIIVDSFKNRNWRALFCEAIKKKTLERPLQTTVSVSETTLQFRNSLIAFVEAMQVVCTGVQIGGMLDYENALSNYVQATCQWYDFLQEQGLIGLLGEENPAYIQAALYISDYFECKAQNVVQALGALKEAVEVFPEFAAGISSFIHNFSALEGQRIAKQKEEMETLRTQVIGQVKAMQAAGQKDAALQIIGQLKQMFPNDLEVATLALDVRING